VREQATETREIGVKIRRRLEKIIFLTGRKDTDCHPKVLALTLPGNGINSCFVGNMNCELQTRSLNYIPLRNSKLRLS
jgi:hypothetical protein